MRNRSAFGLSQRVEDYNSDGSGSFDGGQEIFVT